MPRIFISYRRDDSSSDSNRICNALENAFGPEAVFMDKEIQVGTQFDKHLQKRLTWCDVMLVVVGQKWLAITDEQGQRRLDKADDWVRQEIEAALGRDDVRIIPVLLDTTRMPRDTDLPKSLSLFATYQAISIRTGGADFDWDIKRLIQSLGPVVPTSQPSTSKLTRLIWLALLFLLIGLPSPPEPQPSVQVAIGEFGACAPLSAADLELSIRQNFPSSQASVVRLGQPSETNTESDGNDYDVVIRGDCDDQDFRPQVAVQKFNGPIELIGTATLEPPEDDLLGATLWAIRYVNGQYADAVEQWDTSLSETSRSLPAALLLQAVSLLLSVDYRQGEVAFTAQIEQAYAEAIRMNGEIVKMDSEALRAAALNNRGVAFVNLAVTLPFGSEEERAALRNSYDDYSMALDIFQELDDHPSFQTEEAVAAINRAYLLLLYRDDPNDDTDYNYLPADSKTNIQSDCLQAAVRTLPDDLQAAGHTCLARQAYTEFFNAFEAANFGTDGERQAFCDSLFAPEVPDYLATFNSREDLMSEMGLAYPADFYFMRGLLFFFKHECRDEQNLLNSSLDDLNRFLNLTTLQHGQLALERADIKSACLDLSVHGGAARDESICPPPR